ncbi:MAG: DNA mismatch repair protein MutS [Rhodospirillaceae bacterium]|nr:DNA mismatch repair protein MutS [Rhodospirillaceae bacterium]
MMAQYREAKAAHPDCLVFFRMGDFFELFFDDAVKAAAALDIALTERGGAPMAGVPERSHEAYLARLIRLGFKVALCDQVETPEEARKRGGKPLLRRDVVRVVTPGTLTEDSLLESRASNYLAALAGVGGGQQPSLGLAYADITTGELALEPVDAAGLAATLARLQPGEILLPEGLFDLPALAEPLADWRTRSTVLPNSRFDSENGRRRLETMFAVGTLDGFGAFTRAEIAAAGSLVDYVALTQKGRLPVLTPPRRRGRGSVMEMDAATRRNLEVSRTLDGQRKGSLLDAVDRTVTGPGARLLAGHLAAPLTDPDAIGHRLDGVAHFVANGDLRDRLRRILRQCPDLERSLGRLSLGRSGPRDLGAVREALSRAAEAEALLSGSGDATVCLAPPPLVAEAAAALAGHGALVDRLDAALAADLPALARDGGFIAPGYEPRLDEQRRLRDDSRRLIAELQARYAEATGISALKIRHNSVLGYFVEVSALQADKLGAGGNAATFIHRQTLSGSVRFTTLELSELERSIAAAADRALALELELFAELSSLILGDAPRIAAAARALAALDVAAGQAELAVAQGYQRPVVDDSLAFHIVGGRHPVVEQSAAAGQDGTFVPNDCDLSPRAEAGGGRLWLLTGPNMAGKSTFLRQNALLVLLAQAGGFVPAESARIGVVDRLFSRVGAADDLARGRSTFMVEMVETAAILHQAGPRSLVILDEIGRGTATYDGLSIAWATIEYLHTQNRCRGLFATHYHELTVLADSLDELACHTMRVKEWRGDIVFLHEVSSGTADRSYGIHVARLAGLPAPVTARAEAVLHELETGEGRRKAAVLDDLPLFSAAMAAKPQTTAQPSPLDGMLRAVQPDALTPREALDLIYALKAALNEHV